jgi:hypothetical protein
VKGLVAENERKIAIESAHLLANVPDRFPGHFLFDSRFAGAVAHDSVSVAFSVARINFQSLRRR